ncbi:hypothetical protein EV368DRAFT_84843 [Lentinula lateritia]|nr:hypothetical protein EV368DRAFT_84843 [Lentinula lateritia]
MSSTGQEPKEYKSLLIRGNTESSPFSRALFIILRFIDLPIQYAILSSHSISVPSLIRSLGGTSILPTATDTPRSILLGMTLAAFAKQIYWVLAVSMTPVTPKTSALISLFNLSCNIANTVLFVNVATSVLSYNGPSRSRDETIHLPIQMIVGLALFVLGLAVEWVSEIQRTRFKTEPRNRGQIYTKGLFAYTRHINYTGYVLWRAGFATAAAGWGWGLFVASAFTYDFLTRGIPELDQYCERKYGEGWAQYKKVVPYKLFPFIV